MNQGDWSFIDNFITLIMVRFFQLLEFFFGRKKKPLDQPDDEVVNM